MESDKQGNNISRHWPFLTKRNYMIIITIYSWKQIVNVFSVSVIISPLPSHVWPAYFISFSWSLICKTKLIINNLFSSSNPRLLATIVLKRIGVFAVKMKVNNRVNRPWLFSETRHSSVNCIHIGRTVIRNLWTMNHLVLI